MRTEGQNVSMTMDELQKLMTNLAAQQQGPALTEALKAFATELRKPDPEVEAKNAAAKLRAETNRANRIKEINLEIQAKADREKACEASGHAKENGRSAIYQGQVHNDGAFHPRCFRCGKEFATIKATVDAMTAG